MQIDEEQIGLTVGSMDEVSLPHLVTECAGPLCSGALLNGAAVTGSGHRLSADLDDLDAQRAARRLVLDDVARGPAEQSLSQR